MYKVTAVATFAIVMATPGIAISEEFAHPIGTVCLPKEEVDYDPEGNREAWDTCTARVSIDLSHCPAGGYGFMHYKNEPDYEDVVNDIGDARGQYEHNINTRASADACSEP